ncbi:MAG: membrane protein insertion efficiency factor YidD [Deltaproteobacteria bacterium]|nr:MAG: membrane protein insertion efficiency factor YidD [Deltaproteobacteria bacterium]
MKRVAIALLRVYQRLVSPLKPMPTCRFAPTCSQYAIEAIERRGLIVGLGKALWRLARCHPFGGSGFDPVDPPRALAGGRGDRKA